MRRSVGARCCSVGACAFARRQLVRKGDVIMAVDSDKIASDGSVRLVPTAVPMGQQRRMMSCAQVVFRKGERISFHFKISQKFVGDKVLRRRRRRSACGAWLCVGTLAAADTSCALHAACCCHCLSPRQVMLDVMRDGKTMKIELALTTCALLQNGMRPAVPSTGVVIRIARRLLTAQASRTDAQRMSAVHTRIDRHSVRCSWALLTVVGRAASRVSCHSTCTMRPQHLLQQARSNQQSKIRRNRPLRRMRPNR